MVSRRSTPADDAQPYPSAEAMGRAFREVMCEIYHKTMPLVDFETLVMERAAKLAATDAADARPAGPASGELRDEIAMHMKWRPISEAPTDGTPVHLAFLKRNPKFTFGTFDQSSGTWHRCFGGDEIRFAFAFMPLPKPQGGNHGR